MPCPTASVIPASYTLPYISKSDPMHISVSEGCWRFTQVGVGSIVMSKVLVPKQFPGVW